MPNSLKHNLLKVKVKTHSKKESIEFNSESECTIRTSAPAIENRANERIIEMLAEYFDIAKNQVTLIRGHKSKIKIFKITF